MFKLSSIKAWCRSLTHNIRNHTYTAQYYEPLVHLSRRYVITELKYLCVISNSINRAIIIAVL